MVKVDKVLHIFGRNLVTWRHLRLLQMLSSSCEGLGLRYKSLYLSGPSEPAVPNFFPGGVIFFLRNNAKFYVIYVIFQKTMQNFMEFM